MLPHFGTCLFYRAHALLTTVAGRGLARIWGVMLGKACSFRGLPQFRRMPGSIIRLGNQCTLNSRSEYNYIGINHPCIFSTLRDDAAIIIGDGCGFSGTVIGCETRVTLGNRVRCGANTVITDNDWHPEDPRRGPSRPVTIEDDVWLGLNVTVLKGVTIGSRSIIGTGSVVTTSIPPNVVAAGIPAKVIRSLDPSAPT